MPTSQSTSSQTNSRHSLVTLKPSSATACGTANDSSSFLTPTTPFFPFLLSTDPRSVCELLVSDSVLFIVVDLPFAIPLLVPFDVLVVVICDSGAVKPVLDCESDVTWEADWDAASNVSSRTSERTRSISAGKVVYSPLRRRESAWACTREGQFVGEAWRACDICSCILQEVY
jgi:hypothetical protein